MQKTQNDLMNPNMEEDKLEDDISLRKEEQVKSKTWWSSEQKTFT